MSTETEVLFAAPETGQTGPPEEQKPEQGARPPTPPTGKKLRGPGSPFFEIAWDGTKGEYYYALWSGNGRLLCVSAHGYEKKKQAIEAIKAMQAATAKASQVLEAPGTP